jgi:hypothetical protein
MSQASLCGGTLRFSLLLLPLLVFAADARGANLLLTLSSPDDLNHLTVGQVAHVDVSMTGLAAGEQLVTLTSGVTYSLGLLGPPTLVQAGPIVPDPLNALADFQTTTTANEADASFLTSSNAAAKDITSNGDFYSFQVTGAALGTGSFHFDPLALIAEQFDPGNPNSPILRTVDAGPALNFTVVVPEPQSGLLGLTVAAAVGALVSRRRGGAEALRRMDPRPKH